MSETTIKGPEDRAAAAQLEGLLPEELYKAGARHLKARDYASARACLEKYLEHKADDPAAMHLLARVLYHQNVDFDKALELLDRAAELDPEHLTGYLETKGVVLIHQEEYEKAQEVLEYALSQDLKKDARHTAALKFYLDLVKKKARDGHHSHLHLPHPPHRPNTEASEVRPKPNDPEIRPETETSEVFFTAEYGNGRVRTPLFVLPSIIVHALLVLLISWMSTHNLPFKKEVTDMTYVEVQQPPEEQAPPPEEAAPEGEGRRPATSPTPAPQTPAPAAPAAPAQKGVELPSVPAKVSPAVQPVVAGVEREYLKSPAAPEVKGQGESGTRGAIGEKGGAILAIRPGEIAAVNVLPGNKKLRITDVRPEMAEGEVTLGRKSLTAPAAGAGLASGKQYQAASLNEKTSARAVGEAGPSNTPSGGPNWMKERLAKLEGEGQGFAGAGSMSAAEKTLGLSKSAAKSLQGEENKFAAKPLNIDTGNIQSKGAGQTAGVRSLAERGERIPAYDRLRGNLGAPIPGGPQQEAPAAKAQASLSQPSADTHAKSLSATDKRTAPGAVAGRKFASAEAMPGRRGLSMPEQGQAGGPGGASARAQRAGKLSEKSSGAPMGYPAPGVQAGGGGGYAGTAKGMNKKALATSESEGGLGSLIEGASKRVSDALGFGKPSAQSGPSAEDLKRNTVASLASSGRTATSGGVRGGGSGNGGGGSGGTGTHGTGKGNGSGVRPGSAEKKSSWVVAKAAIGGGYSGTGTGGIPGGKKFAEGALGVPGGGDRYASAARTGTAPRSADRRSALSRGTLLARNTIGPRVRITSPESGNTDRITQTVTGTVSDTRVKKLTLTVNRDSRVVSVEDGSFEASVSLLRGRNTITVMAFDMDGNVGKDSVTVDYSETTEGAPINIISPRNGQNVDVSAKSVINVRGTIGDPEIRRAKLILNGNPMDIVVNRGVFEQKVALAQEQNTITVEATNASSQTTHSQTVTVGTINIKPKDIMIVLSWDKPHADLDLHVFSPSGGHTYYKQPNTYESRDAIPGAELEQDAKGNYGPEVFTQARAEHGIYTVKSNYFYSGGDGNAHAKVTIILYEDNPSRKITRVFGPHLQEDTKDGSDTWEVTRFKMPEGKFLEEEVQ